MDLPTIVSGVLTVGVGAISGGLTNAVAIWMLFHPHDERRFAGFLRLHGAIPKNKARLARSIGKTVGERLLTPEDLAQRLSAPPVKAAFDEAMHRLADELLEQEHGPLREALPPAAADVVDGVISDLGPRVADRLAEYADTDAFLDIVAGWMEQLRVDLADRPVGNLLTPARKDAFATQIDDWVSDLAGGTEVERTLRLWVDNQIVALESDPRPLIDRLPPGLLAPIEMAISDYLPTAIDRISGLMQDSETRKTISEALRKAFDGAARQLLLHERLLAKLVVTETTFERLLDGLERTGYEKFTSALTASATRARVARAIHDSFLGLLRMPLSERLARLEPDKRAALAETLGDWVVQAARSPSTRSSVRSVLERGLDAVGERTWGEVLAYLPPDQAAAAIAEGLRSEGGRTWVSGVVQRAANSIIARPIGRPSAWLGEPTMLAIREGVTATAWAWVQAQVPRVVERLEVPAMVEQKVLGFSTQRMEEIVRGVTQRELEMIVRIGYLLGAFVGLVAFLVNRLISSAGMT
jgi:uncharacterized membrane-anchored protein YjiN (DUF445 family)